MQSWVLYGTIKPYLSLRKGGVTYYHTISANEDLLLQITRNAKNQTVLLLNILFDNEGQGRRGYNIYKLIDKFSEFDSQIEKIESRLTELNPIIRKIRILRNNRMAHFCAIDGWEEHFGDGIKSNEIRKMFSVIYKILSACGKTFDYIIMSPPNLERLTSVYADRLLRALKEQFESGHIGEQFTSMQDRHTMP